MNRCTGWIAAAGLAVMAAMPAMPVLAAAPAVSLSASALAFGSAAWLQPAPSQTLVLTNTGDAALAVQTANITGQPFVPEDFLVSSDLCSSSITTIAPGAQCQITVTFRPQAGGPRSAAMLIYDNAAGSPQSVTLTGTGTGGVVTLSPQQLDFGSVLVGTTSAPMAFAVVNAGDGPVAISRASIDPAFATSGFAISHDGCASTTLGPGQRCTVSATASPTSISSSAFAQVDVSDNVGTGVQKYNLNASGGGPLLTVLALSKSSFNQGVGTVSAPAGFQAFASGTLPIQISSVGLDNSTAGFSIVSDKCSGTTLTPAAPFATPATCEVDVVFAPGAAGSFSANIVFHDNETGGSHSAHLAGSGFAPVAALSTTVIDFGVQADGTTSAPQVLTVTNPSPQSLTMTSAVLAGSNPSYFHLSSDTCSATTVAPGGTCSIGVVFSPPFPFQLSATLSINDSAPGSPQVVSLAGEGLGTAFGISAAHLSFGNIHVNVSSASQAITVTNTSAAATSFAHGPAGPSTITGCSAPVNPGASCTLAVSITPNTAGAQGVRLSIGDSANDIQFVQVDWTGTSGFASLTDGLINNQLIQRAGSSVTVTAVLRNSGVDVLNVGRVSLTGTPPATIGPDNCSSQAIPAGGACTFAIVAAPAVASSWFTTVTVPTDAAVGPNPATIPISGVAAAPTQPVFFPGSVTFPEQALGAAEGRQVVWLVNGLVPSLGAQVTTISSVALGGADPTAFRIVWDGCTGVPVLAAYSCPVSVGFDPTAGRTFTASLIFNDDAVGSPQVVPLSGSSPAPALVSIVVTPTNSSLAVGLTAQFKAIGAYGDGTTADLTATASWASNSTGIATIDGAGLAHAVAAGNTTISATLGSVSGSTPLAITPSALISIAVTPANSSLAKGLSAQFTATGTYGDGSTADLTATVTWASSSAAATIDAAGRGLAAAPGAATISATVGSVVGSTSLTVTAPTLVSIAVTPANSSLVKGLSAQFTATGTYTDASTNDLTTTSTWSCSNSTVATISAGGLVQAANAGMTTITAASGPVSGTTGLTVSPPSDNPLTITNMSVGSHRFDAVAIATFKDADPNGHVSQFTATIDWGDHTTSRAAVFKSPGGFTATGTHRYAKSGAYTVTVTITDVEGASTARSMTLRVR